MKKLVCRACEKPRWVRPEGMPDALYRLLNARGVQSAAEAERFLHPSLADLIEPAALSGMRGAVSVIRSAIVSGKGICVWGDYDVDGVSAVAILTGVLKKMGAKVSHYLPSRHDEGYGLNEAGIVKISEENALLITVDCGITCADLIEKAKGLGLSVVVTDHHKLGDRRPDCQTISPLLNDYPNPGLCGAGVAFKLALALDPEAMDYIDLAALATVADVVPLVGENRALVALGLQRMNERPRPAISALCEAARIRPGTIRSGSVGFLLAPRLNAGGRVGSAERALRLLTAETIEEARPLAALLNDENERRKALELKVVREAEAQLQDFDFYNGRVIALAGADWNPGVVGLACSRLVEKYHLPTILLAESDGLLTGSCRSIEGVDIHACLCAVSKYLLRFGGHKQAAGLTMEKSALPEFRAALNDYILKNTDDSVFVPVAEYDVEVALDALDLPLARTLELLQPTGLRNPAPVFLSEGEIAEARAIGQEGAHLKLALKEGTTVCEGRWWRNGFRAAELRGRTKRVLFAPVIDSYMNRVSLQLDVRDMMQGGDPEAFCPDEARYNEMLHMFLMDRLYNNSLSTEETGDPEPFDFLSIERALRASPRGTLIAVAGLSTLRAYLEALPCDCFDVCLGAWPKDGRGFNALCLLPVGPPPAYDHRLICPDAPAWLFSGTGACGGRSDWFSALPDVESLRTLYLTLRAFFKKPYAASGIIGLCRALSEDSGLSEIAVHAGILALADMELIEFRPEPFLIRARPMKKIDPETSGLYRTIRALSEWGINGE